MTAQVEETTDPRHRIRAKWSKKRIVAACGASAVTLALIAGACSSGDGAEGTETGQSGEVSEGGTGEASEGGSGQGEAAEAGHGGEGGNGEASEGGGTVQILLPADTYDETINGARMTLSFDSAANAFVGTVENTTNATLTRARVEVHLSNGTELGPTTPTDLAPGQMIDISLPSTSAPFTDWTAHAEVGAAEGGKGAEGGNGESGGDGSGESGEGASASPAATYLTSSGLSRGVYTGPELQIDDYYADKLNDLEFALVYDAPSRSFQGRVKNEANEGLCDARIKAVFDGNRANSQSVVIPSLNVRERATFSIAADSGSFTSWSAEIETSTCNNSPVHAGNAEGGEGGNESSGEGAGHEAGGAESASGESGSEGGGENEGPAVPVDQATVATINGLDTDVAYEPAIKAFVGELSNNGTQPICDARLEIHVNRGSSTIELGPTVTADWVPGQTRTMVLGFAAQQSDTYSLHPEAAPCNGASTSITSSAGESGEGTETRGEGSESGGEGSEGAGHESGGG